MKKCGYCPEEATHEVRDEYYGPEHDLAWMPLCYRCTRLPEFEGATVHKLEKPHNTHCEQCGASGRYPDIQNRPVAKPNAHDSGLRQTCNPCWDKLVLPAPKPVSMVRFGDPVVHTSGRIRKSKLTGFQRDDIIRRRREGESTKDLALEFGVSVSYIRTLG